MSTKQIMGSYSLMSNGLGDTTWCAECLKKEGVALIWSCYINFASKLVFIYYAASNQIYQKGRTFMKSLFTLLVLMLAGGLVVTPVLAAEPATQKAKPAAKDAANSQYPHSGKVLSTIDTEMYVYIEVAGKTDKDESIWLAATRTKVEKGDNIRYGEGAPMHNFFSPTLKKTFPTIVFLEKVEVVK